MATIETHLSPAGTEHHQADTEPGLPLGAFNPLLPWTADEVCGQWLGVGMMGTLPSSTSFNISLQWRYWDTPRRAERGGLWHARVAGFPHLLPASFGYAALSQTQDFVKQVPVGLGVNQPRVEPEWDGPSGGLELPTAAGFPTKGIISGQENSSPMYCPSPWHQAQPHQGCSGAQSSATCSPMLRSSEARPSSPSSFSR